MTSSLNVSKMYLGLYLRTNVLIDGSVSNSALPRQGIWSLIIFICPFVNLYVMSYM